VRPDTPSVALARGPWLIWTGAALGLLLLHALSFRFVIDDAFISFRFAQNLVDGHGLVFNVGDRVEGYSNLLYVLLTAVGLKLGLDPLLWGRFLGTAAMAGLLTQLPVITARLERTRPASRYTGHVAQVALAGVGAVACWMLGGLETPLFALWAVLGWRFALGRESLGAGVAGLLLVLTRPEGPALAAIFMVWSLLPAEDRLRPRTSRLRRWLGPVLLVAGVAAFFLWRHSYYGWWLPNTYYAKTGDLMGQIKTGLPYAGRFLLSYGLALGAIVGVALLRGGGDLLRRRDMQLSAGLILFWLGYTVVIGGDMLGMFRFWVPLLPVLVTWCAAMAARTGWLTSGRGAVIGAAVLAVILLPASFAGKERRLVSIHMSEANLGGWILAGDAMKNQLPSGSTIALGPAGYIPYVTGFQTWDFYGIIDGVIAHRDVAFDQGYAGHEKHDGLYIVSRRPDYLLIGNVDITDGPRNGLVPPHVREVDIVLNKDFQRDYEQIYLPVGDGKFLNMFRRKTP